METVLDEHFWSLMRVLNIVRAPVARLHCWLQKQEKDDEARFKKKLDLVTGRAESTLGVYNTMLSRGAYGTTWGAVAWTSEVDVSTAVMFAIEMASDFCRRIAYPLRMYPHCLLWLVWSPAHVVCERRQHMATQFLRASADEIQNDLSIKLRLVWYDELSQAAVAGTLNIYLYNLLKGISDTWQTDTQEIEGTKNVLKHTGELASSISWPLLSSRVTIKKCLNDQGIRIGGKQSACLAKCFVDACVASHDASVMSIAGDEGSRFNVVNCSDYPSAPSVVRYHNLFPRTPTSCSKGNRRCVAKCFIELKCAWEALYGEGLSPSSNKVLRIRVCDDTGECVTPDCLFFISMS